MKATLFSEDREYTVNININSANIGKNPLFAGVIYRVVFLFLMLFFSFETKSADKTGFSIAVCGNRTGDYKKIDREYTLLSNLKLQRKNLVRINAGNNMTGETDKIFEYYLKNMDFSFSFLGEYEFLNKKYMEKKIKYSTLNVQDENIIPYTIERFGNFLVAAAGVTNIYSNVDKGINHMDEIKKFIYKIKDKSNCIILISDLTRAENIQILKQFKEITVIFETGDTAYYEEIIKIGRKYIFPVKNVIIADFKYDEIISKRFSDIDENMSEKSIILESYTNIDNFDYFESDFLFKEYIEKEENIIKSIGKEIITYNNQKFNREDVYLGENIDVLNETGKVINAYFRTDFMIVPSLAVKGGLEKGMVSRESIKEIIADEKIILIKITKEELDKLIIYNQTRKGTEKYLYFANSEYLEDKKEYILATFELFLKNNENEKPAKYEIIKKTRLNMRDFIIRR